MMDSQQSEQKRVNTTAALAMLVIIASLYLAINYYPLPTPSEPTPSMRLVYAFRFISISLLPLIFGIQNVATRRFNDMKNLGFDPTKQKVTREFQVAERFVVNTLEQTFLHVVIQLSLATMLPADWLGVTPTFVVIFVIGRILYFYGYMDEKRPTNRAFGFVLTFLGNIVSLAMSIGLLVWNGPNFEL